MEKGQTVEPRYNEVARYRKNVLGPCYREDPVIGHYLITKYLVNNKNNLFVIAG